MQQHQQQQLINGTVDASQGITRHAFTTQGGLLSPESSQYVESGYLSGGTTSKNNLPKERATPKYPSSSQLDQGFNSNQSSNQKQQTNALRHKVAVQNSIKHSNTPLSNGGRRPKRVSAYEASDDESVLEFQNMENQLLRDGGNSTRKSNMHLAPAYSQQQQQDAASPLLLSGANSEENSATAKANTNQRGSNKNVSQGFSSKIQQQSSSQSLKQQQSQKNSSQPQKKSTFGMSQKQSQTKPIAVAAQPPSSQSSQEQQKQTAKAKSGGCCGIFCCGYCCSKGTGISEKDKTQEMDLRPEQKPEIQEQQKQDQHTALSKLESYKYYGGNEQDLSLIDEVVDYNSVSQSNIQTPNQERDLPQLLTDSGQVGNSQVIEDELEDAMDMEELNDEEKIELDLRSDNLKQPMSGLQSASGHMRSLKSSTDPADFKNPSLLQHPLAKHQEGSFQRAAGEDDYMLENSFDLDQRNMQKNLNHSSQPRLVSDEGDENNQHYDHQQYNSVQNPQRRYSNDQFMRIEGASPENQLLVQANNQSADGSLIRGKSGSLIGEDKKSADSNSKKTPPVSVTTKRVQQHAPVGSQRMNSEIPYGMIEVLDFDGDREEHEENYDSNDNTKYSNAQMEGQRHHPHKGIDHVEGEENSSFREDMENQSDRTIENDQDQYKLAQAKRMYVIHEVDEDAFSERSSNPQRSRQFMSGNNTIERAHSAYNDINSSQQDGQSQNLQIREQVVDEEDVYGLGSNQGANQANGKHHQTLSLDNDISSMQINASQDIEPHNISNSQSIVSVNQQQKTSSEESKQKALKKSPSGSKHPQSQQKPLITEDPNLYLKTEPRPAPNSAKSLIPQTSQNSNSQGSSEAQAAFLVSPFLQQQSISPIKESNMANSGSQLQFAEQQKSLMLNFQQYMEIEEAKELEQQRASQKGLAVVEVSPKKRAESNQSLGSAGLYQISNISPINRTPKNLSIGQQQQESSSFFRPQSQQNQKAKAMAYPHELNQHEEVIVLNESHHGSPQKSNKSLVQQPEESRASIIIQKVALDKSKLAPSFYSNFDQFLVANSLSQEEKTVKAIAQSNLQEKIEGLNFDANVHNKLPVSDSQKQEELQTQQRVSVSSKPQAQSQISKQQQQAKAAKEKAIKKEQQRFAKQQCAIMIQSHWKGYAQRKEFIDIRDNLRAAKTLRRLLENRFSQIKAELINGFSHAAKEIRCQHEKEQGELMNGFLNACAVRVQSVWRAHNFRKAEMPSLLGRLKAQRRFKAFIAGWQMRKVMQTKEVFAMSQHIKDLNKVQEYFLYVEKNESPLLLAQLQKDRRKAIESLIEVIGDLKLKGRWLKSYIGNKIVENEELLDTSLNGSIFKSPVRDHKLGDVSTDAGSNLKELVTTERFLYDEDLERNPYIFETEDFVRQKFLERRQRDYAAVDIEFVDPQGKSATGLKNRRNLKAVDDDSSRQGDESESVQLHHSDKQKSTQRKKFQDQSFESDMRNSVNPRDNVALPKNKKTFDQMLEDAIRMDRGGDFNSHAAKSMKKSGSKEFLRRKEKYDPQKSLRSKKSGGSEINQKNVDKKRIFKSKNIASASDSEGEEGQRPRYYDQDEDFDNQENDSQYGGASGTNKGSGRKQKSKFRPQNGVNSYVMMNPSDLSFVQVEEEPLMSNKTVLPPSLLQKLYLEQLKQQKFLRTDTGRPVGVNKNKYEVLNKNQQVYPTMELPEDEQRIALGLLELENIFDIYHGEGGPDANSFFKSKDINRSQPKDSKIPLLKEKSLFNKYYEDNLHERLIEDEKRVYAKLTQKQSKWMMIAPPSSQINRLY